MKTIYFLSLMILFSCGSTTEKYDLIIKDVNLINGTGSSMQAKVNVYVKGNRIFRIDSEPLTQKENVINGINKYLIPGLFDCHVHPGESYHEDFARLVHYGITSIFIPGGSSCTDEVFADMRSIGNQDSIPAPSIFHTSHHFTVEGRHPVRTYANGKWVEGKTVFYLRDTAQITELVKQVSKQPILGVKLTIEDGPAPPFVARMPQEFINKTVKEASKHGLEVFAHISDNEELKMAVEAGVQNLVHFTGVNIDWDNEEHLEVVNKLKMLDVSWATTLMIDKSFLYPLNPEWFENDDMLSVYRAMKDEIVPVLQKRAEIYVKVLMEEYGLEQNNLEAFMNPQVDDVRKLYDLGINMVLGTDAGNKFNFYGYSLHEEMQLLQMGGMNPLDIIKMGTLNAAKMMHAEDSLGTIEVGKLADMILLDKNPLKNIENTLSINTVFKRGKTQKRMGSDKN